ncbi:MAG TPA: sigma-70 family RNA polymerase sigma factor [Burkholderiaceae bacterium]|nr:sigma-70 family RNA polymerase sigma factor [Burkholderiaceae bacterium]
MPTSQEPSIPGSAPAQAVASTNEAELLSRVARGDRDAFERLYRSYLPRLTRFLQQVMRRTSVVEEAINDTMLVVWRKAATYSGDSKVSTWIFAIAYRRGLKLLKRFDEPVSDEMDLSSPGEDATESGVMQLELRAVLGAAMAQVSAEQRAVIELTYYQGCAYREIAEIMGCPVDTVKTRMFHARRRLRQLLADRRQDLP